MCYMLTNLHRKQKMQFPLYHKHKYVVTQKSHDTPSLSDSVTSLLSIYQDGEAVVEVHVPGSDQQEALVRKRTAGVLDMGGVSTQIAYEVPKTVSFASPQQVIIHNQFCFCAVFGFCHSPFVLLPPFNLCHSPVKPVCTIFVPWR